MPNGFLQENNGSEVKNHHRYIARIPSSQPPIFCSLSGILLCPYVCLTAIKSHFPPPPFCLSGKTLFLKVTKGKSQTILHIRTMRWTTSFFTTEYVASFHRVSTRYGQEAELKEQNQHLMTVNEELQKNLTETQVTK